MITSICIVILVFCKDHRFQKSLLLRREENIFLRINIQGSKKPKEFGIGKVQKYQTFWQLFVVRRNLHHFYRNTQLLHEFFKYIFFYCLYDFNIV